MAEKLDLKKQLKAIYTSSANPSLVEVPPGSFLAYEGWGAPGGEAYATSIDALYAVAFTLKFTSKAQGKDFVVMPLEGLWWLEDPEAFFTDVPPEQWSWKSLIRLPDFIAPREVEVAREEARAKKGLEAIGAVRLEVYHEGLCAQILHVGPYAEERPTIDLLHDFIRAEGYRLRGAHHEIYLSDPNRTAPERLKTIIRQPIEKA